MQRLGLGRILFGIGVLGTSLGAAPAAPSYYAVQRPIDEIRKVWAEPGAKADANAPGWNTFFDALNAEFRTFSAAGNANDQLASLNRLEQMSTALQNINWGPAARVRDELRAWLAPRTQLASAQRTLTETVAGGASSADPQVAANHKRWIEFVDNDLGAALRAYDSAPTVIERRESLKRIQSALESLRSNDQRRTWAPAASLDRALSELFSVPNFDISADVATLTPVIEQNLVTTGPVYRKGYVSQVTAGAKTGYGLLDCPDGVAFYNRQLLTSVTPIHDFYSQMQQDQRGQRAAKMYYFWATTIDQSEMTVTAIIRPSGLQLIPSQTHNTEAQITSAPNPCEGGMGRAVASLIGFNQERIRQEVYNGAIGKMRQNVVVEAKEESGTRIAKAAAEQNQKLSEYLIGNDSLAIRNILITNLALRSRPENALIGGKLQWRGDTIQPGADAPQPASLTTPDPGVSADLHLSSILTGMTHGYFQTEAMRGVDNLMIETRKIPPDAAPDQRIKVSRNVDYTTFLTAVANAEAANDPKVVALRVKKPSTPPEFAADSRGFLVAIVRDFQIDLPGPKQQNGQAGIGGLKAKALRVTSPQAEFVISFKVTPEHEKEPLRLAGRIEGFDAGPQGRVLAVNEDEKQAAPVNAFTSALILGVIRAKMTGQEINVPLSNLKLQGFAINSVSPLEPSGWLRVNLVRTSESPGAGVH